MEFIFWARIALQGPAHVAAAAYMLTDPAAPTFKNAAFEFDEFRNLFWS
jgi:hypothetical protein